MPFGHGLRCEQMPSVTAHAVLLCQNARGALPRSFRARRLGFVRYPAPRASRRAFQREGSEARRFTAISQTGETTKLIKSWPRVEAIVHASQTRFEHVCVYLCGRKVRMP